MGSLINIFFFVMNIIHEVLLLIYFEYIAIRFKIQVTVVWRKCDL